MHCTFRFKWGVGRIIYEAPDLPIIIPIWHIGMDDVLPNEPPYYLRMGKKLTYNFGNPIDLSALMERLRSSPVSEEEARKQITDRIQEEMMVGGEWEGGKHNLALINIIPHASCFLDA